MPAGLRIHLYCLCWNDARLLPYFFRHYDEIVDEYFVFDNGSTDESTALLKAHERVQVQPFEVKGESFVDEERRFCDQVWQPSRGKADWVIVTDIDEHLFRPGLIDYLIDCKKRGITAIESLGYEMVASDFPSAPKQLTSLVTRGGRSAALSRLCIFDPNALTATRFGPGREKAWPEGHVVWPASSEVLLLRFQQLGLDYFTARSAALVGRLKKGDFEDTWGGYTRWSADGITERWARAQAEAVAVPGLGELSHVAPVDFRGDEKIVDESGLLDADWYLSHYRDLYLLGPDPLIHFCRFGWREGRRPNFYFDPARYAAAYMQSDAGKVNPLVHYILEGERAGNRPSEHFDTRWYRERHALEADESPLRHFLLRRHTGRVAPVPEFDLDDYCDTHPQVVARGRDPYEEHVREETRKLTNPDHKDYPGFEDVLDTLGLDPRSQVYPAQIPWASVLDLLRLFVERYPLDESWYRENYPDVDQAIKNGDMESASIHFVRYGFFEGRFFRAPVVRAAREPASEDGQPMVNH